MKRFSRTPILLFAIAALTIALSHGQAQDSDGVTFSSGSISVGNIGNGISNVSNGATIMSSAELDMGSGMLSSGELVRTAYNITDGGSSTITVSNTVGSGALVLTGLTLANTTNVTGTNLLKLGTITITDDVANESFQNSLESGTISIANTGVTLNNPVIIAGTILSNTNLATVWLLANSQMLVGNIQPTSGLIKVGSGTLVIGPANRGTIPIDLANTTSSSPSDSLLQQPVPEPSALGLLATGAALFGVHRRKR